MVTVYYLDLQSHLFGLSILDILNGDLHFVSVSECFRNLGLQLELQSLLDTDPLEHLGDLSIDAHAADVG